VNDQHVACHTRQFGAAAGENAVPVPLFYLHGKSQEMYINYNIFLKDCLPIALMKTCPQKQDSSLNRMLERCYQSHHPEKNSLV
jgi:hypothetical protein